MSTALSSSFVAWGSADQVAARMREHLTLGADHVCVQLLTESEMGLMDGYRRLAEALTL